MSGEYISREAAITSLCCDCSATRDCRPGERCVDYARLKEIPAADVVEVVRCRDCKYRDYDDAPYGKKVAVCTGAMAYSQTPDDWYCPMGKRKDGGQDDD